MSFYNRLGLGRVKIAHVPAITIRLKKYAPSTGAIKHRQSAKVVYYIYPTSVIFGGGVFCWFISYFCLALGLRTRVHGSNFVLVPKMFYEGQGV